jgi:hypothetical protein
MKKLQFSGTMFFLLGLFICLSISSCKKKEDPSPSGSSETAYLYTGRYTTPDGRIFLMGAFPDVPTSNPDKSKLTQLTGTSVATFTYNGFVYSWDGEASTMTKWKVEDNLKLTKLDVLSFVNTGISGNNFGAAFFSETEAYLPGLRQNIMVKWNPADMTITESITVQSPNTIYEAWNWRTYISGDNLVIPLELQDYDKLTVETKVIVAIFNTKNKTITYAEDTRVPGNSMMFPDENGNLYSYPSSTTAFMKHYGPDNNYPALGGMVRINKGESNFDPNFYVNVMEVTGGAAIMGMFYAGNNNWLVKQYKNESDFPATNDLWSFPNKELEFKLMNHDAKTSVAFPGKSNGYSGNNSWFIVDGIYYHQNPNKVTGNTEIGTISANGWEKVFEIQGGDLSDLARIR